MSGARSLRVRLIFCLVFGLGPKIGDQRIEIGVRDDGLAEAYHLLAGPGADRARIADEGAQAVFREILCRAHRLPKIRSHLARAAALQTMTRQALDEEDIVSAFDGRIV